MQGEGAGTALRGVFKAAYSGCSGHLGVHSEAPGLGAVGERCGWPLRLTVGGHTWPRPREASVHPAALRAGDPMGRDLHSGSPPPPPAWG